MSRKVKCIACKGQENHKVFGACVCGSVDLPTAILCIFQCVCICSYACTCVWVCVCVWKTLPVCLCLSNLLQPSRRHLPRSKTKAASTNFSNMWITWSTVLHIAYLSNFFSSSHPILVATAGFPPALGSSLSASFSNCFWLKFKQKCVACTCQQQQKGRA